MQVNSSRGTASSNELHLVTLSCNEPLERKGRDGISPRELRSDGESLTNPMANAAAVIFTASQKKSARPLQYGSSRSVPIEAWPSTFGRKSWREGKKRIRFSFSSFDEFCRNLFFRPGSVRKFPRAAGSSAARTGSAWEFDVQTSLQRILPNQVSFVYLWRLDCKRLVNPLPTGH